LMFAKLMLAALDLLFLNLWIY